MPSFLRDKKVDINPEFLKCWQKIFHLCLNTKRKTFQLKEDDL